MATAVESVEDQMLDEISQRISALYQKVQNRTLDREKVHRILGRILADETFFFEDRAKMGWTLVLDTDHPEWFDITKIKSQRLVDWNEEEISFDEVRRRAMMGGALCGQRHAEKMCFQQAGIPELVTRKGQLVFPGTVWRDQKGVQYCPYIKREANGFFLGFRPVTSKWTALDFLVLPL